MKERAGRWTGQHAFAIAVGLAALVAAYLAWSAVVPQQVPDFALRAKPVYRAEVGAAVFLGQYLVIMAFVLALNNRGFSEIGVKGLKADEMGSRNRQGVVEEHEQSLSDLWEVTDEFANSTELSLQELRMRVSALESSRGDRL
ncbi:MAG TPA: hypothetical protein VNN15_04910 [Solirubrobacterales bacterium]|nr:hypothetical protein [Solirubrobacterales bacterium]